MTATDTPAAPGRNGRAQAREANGHARAPSANGQSGTPSAAVADGRDKTTGQFAPGNKCAVGNPHARRVQQLRNELFAVCTPAALRRVAATLLNRAEAGDLQAAELLLKYTLGRPRAEADPDRVGSGLDLWALLAALPSQREVLRLAAGGVDAAEAAAFLATAFAHEGAWDKLRALGMVKVLEYRDQDGHAVWPPPLTVEEARQQLRARPARRSSTRTCCAEHPGGQAS
jgi:hypothetical protein